ncbi:TROVE domain-containing protein [Oceanirhabdus sp. W0125-5]|uniref:TROVE domain-containing protein n=1 Tax=Oceanirhabdus sp. W0125-5 TaxID=2999116 RepID=UPI0022F344BF|nr:TROVE domain-containing protein [Oceanirhabdus sp. W0125-5]WBW98622.1 TROVE domain-containing protein [Oceanirhabdus sp. W0125-5]
MSKFNSNKSGTLKMNRSGHLAYSMDIKDRLIMAILTSFFNESKFYGDNSEEILEDIRKMIKKDAKFVANLAIYARKEMYLRSISHVLIGELAQSEEGKQYVRRAITEVVQRVDDMTEIVSYTLSNYGKPIPNSMKKGIADAFITFDEYSLAKYNRKKDVRLKDLLCLTHPKAKTEEQNHMFKRVLEDKLKTLVTWEVELSTKGNNKETWEELIAEKRLGYMAALRNLRNIIKAQPNNLEDIYNFLSDENRVRKSKQLPFRYYSAYNVLRNEGLGTSKVYDTLEKAIEYSTKNIETLKGKTMISADVSGSMSCCMSGKSDISCAEIAVLMMAIANHICEETITTTFDTHLYSNPISTRNGIIANANSIPINGGGTNITLPIRYLLDNNIFVDRIIILSDNEINSGYNTCQYYVEQYKKKVNPDVWIHAIDLQGYGTQQFHGEKVNIIAGWNEKVLEFIHKAEKGTESLKEKIEKYHFE